MPAVLVRIMGTLFAAFSLAAGTTTPPAVLTRAAQIRALSPEEASREIPVRLRVVIIHYDPQWNDIFVHDETGEVYVAAEGRIDLRQGQFVEVTGVTGPGEFAPVVLKPSIRVLGPGRLPLPRKVSYEDLISGTFDSAFVEVQGTIRSAALDKDRLNLYLGAGTAHMRATVVKVPPTTDVERFINARVTLRGACGSTFTKRRQLTGIILHVQSLNDVIIRESRHEGLEVPLERASSLLRFSPKKSVSERVRVRGVVIYRQASELYIRDGGQGLMVQTHQPLALAPGDLVEATGLPELGAYNPTLKDVTLRRLGSGPAPPPFAVTAQAVDGDYDSDLVEIEADLVSRTTTDKGQQFGMKSGSHIFSVDIDTLAAWRKRSRRCTELKH